MTGFGSSCGACKFLRRRCTSDCTFAPYFCYDQAATHFAAVHRVFGASNVSKLLLHLPLQNRGDAAATIPYKALVRTQDPIYGCVAHIFELQQQVADLHKKYRFWRIIWIITWLELFAVEVPGLKLMNLPFGNINVRQAFYSKMNAELPSLPGWEEQNFLPESSTNDSLRIVDGLEHEDFAYYPWLDIDSNATNALGPTW